jgi:RNA polymerase sigma-70 factor (ECF subfamily)
VLQNETEIVKAIQAGNEKSFELFFKSNYQRLCRYAFTFMKDKDEAEEIAQNVFVTMWEKRNSLSIETSIDSYMFRAVRNASLNKIKHQKVRQDYSAEQVAILSSAEPSTHLTLKNELQKQINEAIESLPEQCRIIFKLSRFEELKYSEIAEHMNLSVKTVENQMGKALRIMRDKLKDYLVLLIITGLWAF